MALQTTSTQIAFGISSYAYTWAIGLPKRRLQNPMGIRELLDAAHRLGAERLQVADNLPVHELTRDQWEETLGKAEKYNIGLELGMRGLKPERISQYLSLAQECKAPFLRIVIDEGAFQPSIKEIKKLIANLLPDLKQAGVPLAIENHDRFRARDLLNILKSLDTEYVGICLDTANSLGADEGIYEVATMLAPYTLNLHVKDYEIRRLDHQMGFTILGTAAGNGQAPVPWLLELLKKYGRCKSAILEQWSTPLATIEESVEREQEWVEQGAVYLKKLLT